MTAPIPFPSQPSTFEAFTASFVRTLEAEQKSPHTIRAYDHALRQLHQFCTERSFPDSPIELTSAHLIEFLRETAARKAPKTGRNYYEYLASFYSWLVREEELAASPLKNVKAPPAPARPAPCLTDTQLGRLFAVTAGGSWLQRRDRAMLRMFMSTGVRVEEMSRMNVHDVDWAALGPGIGSVVTVRRKGGRVQPVPFGRKAAAELDRYVRARDQLAGHEQSALWLHSRRARIQPDSIRDMVRARGVEAELLDLHPHLFRHTFAHLWLRDGGSEGDLMRIMGWTNRAMLDRYAASRQEERARAAHRQHDPSEKF